MAVEVKRYNLNFNFDDKEIYRYLGAKKVDEELISLVEVCKKECQNEFSYAVCHAKYDVKINDDKVCFNDFVFCSKDLSSNLKDCNSAVIFVATIGFSIDRLIKKYSTISPVKALIFSAIGSERIERLCDEFCEDLSNEYGKLCPRFSAGYGDLSIDYQKEIFNMLSATKNIQVTLTDSLLMSPTKSVSAIVGVGDNKRKFSGCKACNETNCEFKK